MCLMSFYKNRAIATRAFSAILQALHLGDGHPSLQHFSDVLSETDIQKAFDDADCRFAENEDDVFTPALTLWAFLSQMLFTGAARSCNATVMRVRAVYVCRPCFARQNTVFVELRRILQSP